jgi:hypothetical protein
MQIIALVAQGRAMKAVCDTFGVAGSNLRQRKRRPAD